MLEQLGNPFREIAPPAGFGAVPRVVGVNLDELRVLGQDLLQLVQEGAVLLGLVLEPPDMPHVLGIAGQRQEVGEVAVQDDRAGLELPDGLQEDGHRRVLLEREVEVGGHDRDPGLSRLRHLQNRSVG